jgi:heme A synthase
MAVSTPDRITEDQSAYSSARRIMPVLAVLALISTILLITMGSIVRVTGYGLGCPDWPLCYGRVVPPALTGAWVEFAHRFLGAVASLQIVLLAFFAWRDHRHQPWVFRPAIAAVGLLVIQVSLGGLHVIFEIPPVTGWIHTGVAMLITGLVAVQVAGLLPTAQALRGADIFHSRRFAAWLSVTAVVTYLLLLTGSYVTRSGASLACPSFPLCGSNAPAMRRLIDIQMLHRYAAFSVAFLTLVLIIWLVTRQNARRLTPIAYGAFGLLLVQFALGISNVLLRLPMWSRVLHLAVAATFWASLVVLWSLCCARQPAPEAVPVPER